VGLDNLDGVIRIIREASSNAIASAGLRNGEFSILFSPLSLSWPADCTFIPPPPLFGKHNLMYNETMFIFF
jgi:hypothetical protein